MKNTEETQIKDFKWYVERYNMKFEGEKECSVTDMGITVESFTQGIPMFEFKIGLLKFICDDLRVRWTDVIDCWRETVVQKRIQEGSFTELILKVCPKEFIESIFK